MPPVQYGRLFFGAGADCLSRCARLLLLVGDSPHHRGSSTPESDLWLPIPDENDLSRVGIFLQHFQASFPPTSLPVTLADHTAVQGVEGGIEGLRDLGRRATPFQLRP